MYGFSFRCRLLIRNGTPGPEQVWPCNIIYIIYFGCASVLQSMVTSVPAGAPTSWLGTHITGETVRERACWRTFTKRDHHCRKATYLRNKNSSKWIRRRPANEKEEITNTWNRVLFFGFYMVICIFNCEHICVNHIQFPHDNVNRIALVMIAYLHSTSSMMRFDTDGGTPLVAMHR